MTTTSHESEAPGGDTALKRAIGPKLLILFVIGDILGTGIYATTGKVAGKVGGAVWLPFVIGFVVALLTAASYVELVGKYPKAAGAALYTQKAFRIPFLTFIIAFMVMCSGLSSASAAARAFSGDYFTEFTDAIPATLVAILFILALAALNLRGVSESVKTNVVLTLVELSGLAIVLAIGAWAVVSGDGEPSRLGDFQATGTGYALITSVLGATALGFFAFVGFEDSVNMAEETKDPVRSFPRAIFMGVAVTGTIYVLVALASSLLVDHRTLEKSSGPLLEVVKAGGVDFPPKLFALIALFAVTNSALINIMMASRLCYGMANERILPRVMGKVLSGRRTPVVGIVFVSAAGDRTGLDGRDRRSRRHHRVPAALCVRNRQRRGPGAAPGPRRACPLPRAHGPAGPRRDHGARAGQPAGRPRGRGVHPGRGAHRDRHRPLGGQQNRDEGTQRGRCVARPTADP